LTALRKHEPDCRVIVVDDGLDCVVDVEVQYERHITFVEGAKPFVFARNVNIGIRAAGDSDVVILNDDALLESPGGFQLLQKAALNRPEVGIIGAVTNVTGQPLQTRSGGYRGDPKYGLRIVPHIAFVCVLIPRRTIEAVGLLDERYCLDYGVEDRDYCEAVTRAGLKVAVHDGCFVDHGSLTSTFRGDPRAPKRFDKNYALFKEKWGIA
jgi:GT2 family glycosyltransferase